MSNRRSGLSVYEQRLIEHFRSFSKTEQAFVLHAFLELSIEAGRSTLAERKAPARLNRRRPRRV